MTININDIWIDVETLARLKGKSKRAVRMSLKKNYIWKTEKRKGGEAYLIKLTSIEEDYQKKFIEEYKEELAAANGDLIELNNLNIVQEKFISPEQKKLALAKYDLVQCWLDFKKDLKKQKNIIKDKKNPNEQFIELYNTGMLYEGIYQVLGKVSINSLYRWRNLLTYNADWTALVGQYKYSTRKEYQTSLNEEQKKIFLTILLSPNSFSIGKAISLTKHILKERGQNIFPKDISFRRFAEWFKDNNYDKWILAREGQKALKDKVEPYIVRNAKLLDAGQVLIADGHTLNFQVINPFTGKPCRATLLGFLDWKSGGLVGYDIMLEECTQNITSALRNAILKMDHIPEFVYQDNGRAFKSKFFNGDKKFEEMGFTGVYQRLGIKPIYATPYNARAKVIERFFLEFQESFEKLIPSYIGTSIEAKPAYLKRNEKLHKQIHEQKANFVPTIEQAIALIDKWLEYKHSQPCPNEDGKTIQEVLNSIPKQNIDENRLDDLMMAQEIKSIGRNGIRFLKADYFDDSLYGVKEKTIIKYSLFDLTYIKVYTMKGEFICRANRVTETHPLANELGDINDMEDYKYKIKRQANLRRKTIKAVKEHFKITDLDLIEKNLIETLSQDCCENDEVYSVEPTKKQIKQQEKPKVIYKEKSTIVRPLFSSNYERFEWHMNHGCMSQEDRIWLKDYMNSEEYKKIYK